MRVAVASRSFSRHPVLRAELLARHPGATFNEAGAMLRGADLVAFLSGHDAAITALEPLDEALLRALPELRVVGKFGVGVDMLDLAAMARLGVRLGWTPGVNRRAVSELVIALAISLLRHLSQASGDLKAGVWRQRAGRQLGSQVVGIVGCGNIGKDLAVLLRAFGARVLAHDILDFPDFYRANGVEPVGLEALLGAADIVTLHLPLDGSTRGILDARRLALMKPGALLINAARGGLVDEAALKAALKEGRLGGAAIDAHGVEPPEDRELVTLPNVLATPHLGGHSEEGVLAMGRAAIEGLERAEVPGPGHPAWPRVP